MPVQGSVIGAGVQFAQINIAKAPAVVERENVDPPNIGRLRLLAQLGRHNSEELPSGETLAAKRPVRR